MANLNNNDAPQMSTLRLDGLLAVISKKQTLI
ncbi:Uncharacterised protein [Serratia grimesii]|jgi:hypothetical protein|nr:Uncharacterised protein [Serratia grimesii]CAI0864007.1 Uncharacterised protein [Serratia grimesii]CAI1108977.1 Uncharacterised protein [Serratia grimesii]CAI1572713.1 Uncharacterised protein [Serratia grimesii]CAI2435669.1 Uncharacterised protein [Serratia grimesii]